MTEVGDGQQHCTISTIKDDGEVEEKEEVGNDTLVLSEKKETTIPTDATTCTTTDDTDAVAATETATTTTTTTTSSSSGKRRGDYMTKDDYEEEDDGDDDDDADKLRPGSFLKASAEQMQQRRIVRVPRTESGHYDASKAKASKNPFASVSLTSSDAPMTSSAFATAAVPTTNTTTTTTSSTATNSSISTPAGAGSNKNHDNNTATSTTAAPKIFGSAGTFSGFGTMVGGTGGFGAAASSSISPGGGGVGFGSTSSDNAFLKAAASMGSGTLFFGGGGSGFASSNTTSAAVAATSAQQQPVLSFGGFGTTSSSAVTSASSSRPFAFDLTKTNTTGGSLLDAAILSASSGVDTEEGGIFKSSSVSFPSDYELKSGEEDEEVLFEKRCKTYRWGPSADNEAGENETATASAIVPSVPPSQKNSEPIIMSSSITGMSSTTAAAITDEADKACGGGVAVVPAHTESSTTTTTTSGAHGADDTNLNETDTASSVADEKHQSSSVEVVSSSTKNYAWHEVGIGPLKVLRTKQEPKSTRFVQRRESTPGGPATIVILNARLSFSNNNNNTSNNNNNNHHHPHTTVERPSEKHVKVTTDQVCVINNIQQHGIFSFKFKTSQEASELVSCLNKLQSSQV